ncbi:MAG: response regulator, partial [Ruminococcus sp.]|nr:response regulator [Ruminococcus sp.]
TSFCILFIMVISILISGLGRNAMDWFVELTSFCAVVGFGYASISALKIARDEKNRRVQITGFIGLAVSVIFGMVLLASKIATVETMSAPSFLLLALWCLAGFFFYWRTMRQSNLSDYHGVSNSSIVLFCLLFYAAMMWYVKSLIADSSAADFTAVVIRDSVILFLVAGAGLCMMLYVQNMLRKRHERLEREVIHAEESGKAKTQFLFNMSHDIRTPMNAIIGYAHLASQEEDVPPKIRDYIEKIDTSGKHLLTLINDILEMGQIENGKLELQAEPNNLLETVRTAYEMFRIQMENKHITFTLDTSRVRREWVMFDRNRFLRVILNLLSNAYKFTPEGGSVTMTLCQISENDETAAYELTVADTGIGMSKEFAENVFEAFARERTSTVSHTQGTGLGMAITKNIVELMGGSVTVVTAPGEGTAFTAHLPLAVAEPPQEDTEDEAAPVDFSTVRLLLAEDNEINRDIVTMILSQTGCQVEAAADGQQAVEMVSRSAPGYYDVVLMDIQMPVMDGFAATRAIRSLSDERLSRIPIIAITANAFREDELAAKEAGMQAHIAKPLDVDKMLRTISEVLRNAESTDER